MVYGHIVRGSWARPDRRDRWRARVPQGEPFDRRQALEIPTDALDRQRQLDVFKVQGGGGAPGPWSLSGGRCAS
jgi:hypothetical protein